MQTQTDITVLDHLMVLNLDVNIWSARRKLTPADFAGAELPPEELASLGSKKVCNPKELRIFGTLKARAVNMLDRNGVRFLSGWGIPEDRADAIVADLTVVRDDFLTSKEQFLSRYDEAVQDWVSQHPGWERLIGNSTVSADHVRARLDFKWQMFRLAAPQNQKVSQGLQDEVVGLGGTLFEEIAKAATEAWICCFEGKDKVTHKALSPLKSIQRKLSGLRFVEPRVLPVADLLKTAFQRIPARGHIQGADLILLQGVVSLLRDPATLIGHGQKILDGQDASSVLDALLAAPTTDCAESRKPRDKQNGCFLGESSRFIPEAVEQRIDSHGLW